MNGWRVPRTTNYILRCSPGITFGGIACAPSRDPRVTDAMTHEDNARNFGFEFCFDVTRVDETRCSARIAMTFGFD